MTPKTQKKEAVKSSQKSSKETQRKATPAFFSSDEKSKEVSRKQSSATAEVENHYVNGAMKQTNVSVNRGK